MSIKSLRRRSHTRLVVLAAVTALLAGCSAASETPATGQGTALSNAEIISNPKNHVGASTAYLTHSAINPVAKDPVASLPSTIEDAQGSSVTISDISRILPLDLYGTSSRIVFDLGLGKNVVGRDVSSDFEEIKDRPLVTHNGHELNAESILELAPSVIITDSSLGPWDVVLQMREAGIPVVVVDSHRSLENTSDLITQIATALGVPEQGVELAKRTTDQVTQIMEKISAIAPQGDKRLRMLFLYARGQSGVYYLFGEGSGADSLISSVGGIDVASEIGWKGMRPMTDEALVEAAPDLVIMMSSGLESAGGVEGLKTSVPAFAHTPAGLNNRIVDMADSDVLSFGPNSAGILEALSVAIYAPNTEAN